MEKLDANFSINNFAKLDMFFIFIESFPYPIQIFSVDGNSLMVNKSFIKEFNIDTKDKVVDVYNILKDKHIRKDGLFNSVKKAFSGEIVYEYNIKLPICYIIENFNANLYDIDAIYHDILAFPIKTSDNTLLYITVILIPKKTYHKNDVILKATEFLKTNWKNKYNINELSDHVNYSPHHFARIFKDTVGVTPYRYYLNVKIEKIKECLETTDFSVVEIFSYCGLNYNGHYVSLFKKSVGSTPLKYRELKKKQL